MNGKEDAVGMTILSLNQTRSINLNQPIKINGKLIQSFK